MASSLATVSEGSCNEAGFNFSRRCTTDEVPQMSGISQEHFFHDLKCLVFQRTLDAAGAILFWMSRAFVKEDVDLPERSGRKRSASGLPPGATNYITARGAKRLRDELEKLLRANTNSERAAELEQILASVHVVDPPDPTSNSVGFGATVTVKDTKGRTETYTVVGVDELDLEPDAVSWISPIGKALLAADMGNWITLEDGRTAKIVKIE
jgi:transcription elongation GreA/GreB family factor